VYDRREWIEKRAYFLWVEAGRPDGMDMTFWAAAEREYYTKHNYRVPAVAHSRPPEPVHWFGDFDDEWW
jgi:hypothetical protein